ncbi:MAG: transposase [Chthoniobacterales bacterium]
MARPLRLEFEGAIYHLLGRGNARQRIFASERDRREFLRLLAASAERFEGAVQAFVLMGNHFHLLAQTRQANLSRWMHWLMVSYTVYFNRRHGRSGHLFQGRYKSFLVGGGEYLLGLSRYIHLNPVRGAALGRGTPAERRERLRAYRWSSYRGYAGLEKPLAFVQEDLVLGEMQVPKRNERVKYRRFVEDGLVREIENPFEAVAWQAVLGSESFGRQVRDRLRGLVRQEREVTAVRRGRERMAPEKILQLVGKCYGVPAATLVGRGGYGMEARNVAMALVWEHCALRLREIGELFGGLDYAAVAQRIRRVKKANPARLKKLVKEMSNV